MFPELPFLDRIGAAAEAGFDGIEILFPYDDPVREVTRRLRAVHLPLVLINCPPPNYTGRARGMAAVPGLEDRFRSDFRRSLRFARELGAGRIHVMAGEAEGTAARTVLASNLAWAAAEADDMPLSIEPLNPVDFPGYFLNGFQLAADILAEVGAPSLGLQFDAYHSAMIHGDILPQWDRFGALSTHVQIAGAPGRHEPDTPAVAEFLERLKTDGYTGWVSAEYRPRGETLAGLGWLASARG
ncbi:TIM barrel protein [Rhodobacteraceae bacterium ASV31]|nr:TIM barrel protein [Anianabacter salinae]